ncbi:MAG: hypothetical protein O3A96_00260 [Proteobacteria bacterium]|nr:hypothetical protein [Pseudomonadota bacterium]
MVARPGHVPRILARPEGAGEEIRCLPALTATGKIMRRVLRQQEIEKTLNTSS